MELFQHPYLQLEKEAGLGKILALYAAPAGGALVGLNYLRNSVSKHPGLALDQDFDVAKGRNVSRIDDTVYHDPDEVSPLRNEISGYRPDEIDSLMRMGRLKYNHKWDFAPGGSPTSEHNSELTKRRIYGMLGPEPVYPENPMSDEGELLGVPIKKREQYIRGVLERDKKLKDYGYEE